MENPVNSWKICTIFWQRRREKTATKIIDDAKIYELYQKGMLHREIAKELGCGVSTVTNHLIAMGVRTERINKDKVRQLHEIGLTDTEIAKQLGCTRSNITICLNRMGYTGRKSKVNNLELRDRISKSLIGRYVGEQNPGYKGYIDEKTIARGIFKTFSRRLIRESDFTCQCCKRRGGDLETHHIKPFAVIFNEFLENVYDGNIDTLYWQLMSYPDFIDENNLVVLCHDCHWKLHYTDNHELSPFRWESATTIEKILQ